MSCLLSHLGHFRLFDTGGSRTSFASSRPPVSTCTASSLMRPNGEAALPALLPYQPFAILLNLPTLDTSSQGLATKDAMQSAMQRARHLRLSMADIIVRYPAFAIRKKWVRVCCTKWGRNTWDRRPDHRSSLAARPNVDQLLLRLYQTLPNNTAEAAFRVRVCRVLSLQCCVCIGPPLASLIPSLFLYAFSLPFFNH